jgi:hypothetical protein
MGMMYSWATKEYILWQMTWAQLLMYLNEGMNQKYPRPERQNARKAVEMNYDELAAKREELRQLYGKID